MSHTIRAVPNHPNRSKANRSLAANPTPAEIRALREAQGLTQTEAANLVHATLRAWQNWEAPKDAAEHRPMHPGLWELFRIKTGAAPYPGEVAPPRPD